MFMHTEFISHHTRIRMVTRQISDDIESIRSYLSTFTTGKITPQIIDPKHLIQELIKLINNNHPKSLYQETQEQTFGIITIFRW